MNKFIYLIFFGVYVATSNGEEPFKPVYGSVDFIVYFPSRYRGICVGTLLAPTTVITAAVCVVHPTFFARDTRPINVVAGTSYRHARSGIRVQVKKVLVPKILRGMDRSYVIQKSPAILLLVRKVPDAIADIPLRPINIDYKMEERIGLHEECMTAGWHFFLRGDKIYSAYKFFLPRNLRVQFVSTAKSSLWCSTIELKFQKALANLGFAGRYDPKANLCVRDPIKKAQACHGMYGAPLICHGKMVALLSAPDAQWTNCTGYSNIMHLVSASHLKNFMSCVSSLFVSPPTMSWNKMKEKIQTAGAEDDFDNEYTQDFYDRIVSLED